MRAYALALVALMVSAPLAGCAGSDGDVTVDLSPDEIQELMDANLDDFLNNTTVTVVNNYHNNTTVTNHYNNTTSVDQSGASTSSINTTSTTTNNYNGTSSTLRSSAGTMAGVDLVGQVPVGPTLLVRSDRFANSSSPSTLNGANICIGIGSVLENDLQDAFWDLGITFTSIPIADLAEGTAKFIDGSCDALAFSSLFQAHERKDQLDDDGSMGGVEIWITYYEGSMTNEVDEFFNSISITINQTGDELLYLVSVFTQVSIIADCAENDTSCTPIEIALPTVYDDDVWSITMYSTCEYGLSYSLNAVLTESDTMWFVHTTSNRLHSTGMLPYPGISCSHTIEFTRTVDVGDIPGYDPDSHTISWSDWVYSVVWESTPIENSS